MTRLAAGRGCNDLAQSRSPDRLAGRLDQMAGAAADRARCSCNGRCAISCAAGRARPTISARSPLRCSWRSASRRRRAPTPISPPIWWRSAIRRARALAGAGRRRARAVAMGVFVLIASRICRLLQRARPRILPGLRQSRLFPDQARALGHGGGGDRPGAGRYLPAGRPALMEWVGLALLALVGAGIILTGLPAAVVLVAVATSRRDSRRCRRRDRVRDARRAADAADQPVRERSAAGAAALRDHGPAARPAAGRGCAVPHRQRRPAAQNRRRRWCRACCSARCSGR